MKRWLLGLAAIVICIATLAACGTKKETLPDKISEALKQAGMPYLCELTEEEFDEAIEPLAFFFDENGENRFGKFFIGPEGKTIYKGTDKQKETFTEFLKTQTSVLQDSLNFDMELVIGASADPLNADNLKKTPIEPTPVLISEDYSTITIHDIGITDYTEEETKRMVDQLAAYCTLIRFCTGEQGDVNVNYE